MLTCLEGGFGLVLCQRTYKLGKNETLHKNPNLPISNSYSIHLYGPLPLMRRYLQLVEGSEEEGNPKWVNTP